MVTSLLGSKEGWCQTNLSTVLPDLLSPAYTFDCFETTHSMKPLQPLFPTLPLHLNLCTSLCNRFVLWSQHLLKSFSRRVLGIRAFTFDTQVGCPTRKRSVPKKYNLSILNMGRMRSDGFQGKDQEKENMISSKCKSSPMKLVWTRIYLSVNDDFSDAEHIYELPRSKSKFCLRLMYIFTHHISPKAFKDSWAI